MSISKKENNVCKVVNAINSIFKSLKALPICVATKEAALPATLNPLAKPMDALPDASI